MVAKLGNEAEGKEQPAGAGLAKRGRCVPKRMTRQKRAVYEAVERAGRPLKFEEVMAAARQRCATVSERTVFRILRELQDDQQLVKIALAGQPPLYELTVWENRPYFICTECNQVLAVEVKIRDILRRDKLPKGLVVDGVEIIFRGTCGECEAGTGSMPI